MNAGTDLAAIIIMMIHVFPSGTLAWGQPGVTSSPSFSVPPSVPVGVVNAAAFSSVQAAIDSLQGQPGTVFIPAGTYPCPRNSIRISHPGTHIVGAGVKATAFMSSGGVCFTFEAADSKDILFQTSISGITFVGSGAERKVAIRALDCSQLRIRDVHTYHWTGADSIGLEVHGREFYTVELSELAADLPIDIEPNPNDTIMADMFTFRDLYLQPLDPHQSCITFASTRTGTSVTHFRTEGVNACVGGRGILWWDDPQNPFMALDFSLAHFHFEQAGSCGDFGVHINRAITNLMLEDVDAAADCADRAGAHSGGFYLRNVHNVTLLNALVRTASGIALDADGTVWNLLLLNVFFQINTTVRTTGLHQIWADNAYAASHPANALYQTEDAADHPLKSKQNCTPGTSWGDDDFIYRCTSKGIKRVPLQHF